VKFAIEHKQELEKRYIDEKVTASEIARMYGTYTNKIVRALKFLKIEIRDKSECQKELLRSGKAKHPTQGKKLSEATKAKISEASHNSWENKTPDELEAFKQMKKDAWNNRSADEVENFNNKSIKAIANSSRGGSKAEIKIMDELKKAGYNPLHHHRPLEKEKLEVDIIIPDKRIAIEIDGPSHYKPIWGDINFDRTRKADIEKNGILATNGFCMIRIKHLVNTVTQHMYKKTCASLIKVIEEVSTSFPQQSDRLIYINIADGEITR
jgi:very-short-patch-repair endonuclease